jgi:hypothetical protein
LPISPDSGTVEKEDDEGATIEHLARKEAVQPPRAPANGRTPPAPRLLDDLKALAKLTAFSAPPLRLARLKRVVHVFYGFGDASGKGRGSTFQGFKTPHHSSGTLGPEDEVTFRIGVWTADAEEESSNFR